MTQLYWGSTADFVERATLNTIAETLRQAFFDHLGYNPSESEQRSWRNSLRALATAVQRGGFTDQAVVRPVEAFVMQRPGALLVGR